MFELARTLQDKQVEPVCKTHMGTVSKIERIE